jgi:hypothetical protein
MIEVFKTDVDDGDLARLLVNKIHQYFNHCHANFDLDDCDRILRVKGIQREAEVYEIMSIVKTFGYEAHILPDDDPLFDGRLVTHDTELSNS